jgi:hypothetical protein
MIFVNNSTSPGWSLGLREPMGLSHKTQWRSLPIAS